MDVDGGGEAAVARVGAAIGEPARARMLFGLMDGRARTSTELSLIAEVSPSTASAHLGRLAAARLVTVLPQGKHRYYALAGGEVAALLEGMLVLAGAARAPFVPSTPERLRQARTCYDHLAGRLGVSLHARLLARRWLTPVQGPRYALSADGERGLGELGIEGEALRRRRRLFACACVDWSERRPHLAGALGAALLDRFLASGWLSREADGRALAVTRRGAKGFADRFDIEAQPSDPPWGPA